MQLTAQILEARNEVFQSLPLGLDLPDQQFPHVGAQGRLIPLPSAEGDEVEAFREFPRQFQPVQSREQLVGRQVTRGAEDDDVAWGQRHFQIQHFRLRLSEDSR